MRGVSWTISQPVETPYCIWHPEAPSKDTLRCLEQQYPIMIYHAAQLEYYDPQKFAAYGKPWEEPTAMYLVILVHSQLSVSAKWTPDLLPMRLLCQVVA